MDDAVFNGVAITSIAERKKSDVGIFHNGEETRTLNDGGYDGEEGEPGVESNPEHSPMKCLRLKIR